MWFESAHVEATRDSFPEWMALWFALLSHLGSVWFVAPAVVFCYWFRDRHRFAPWLGIVTGGYAVMVGLKELFQIARPEVGPAIEPEALPTVVALLYAPAVEFETMAFPSGHALAATIVWTMLALESDVGTGRQRLAGAAVMVVLVAFSRVAVGVHYPTDVAVGALVGVGYLAIVLWLRDRVAKTGRFTPTVALFASAATLSVFAMWSSGKPDAAALLGGSLGAALAWRYARPAREPWSLGLRGFGRALFGLALLVTVALVLLVVETTVTWFAVGLAGGLVVVGLPQCLSALSTVAAQAKSTS